MLKRKQASWALEFLEGLLGDKDRCKQCPLIKLTLTGTDEDEVQFEREFLTNRMKSGGMPTDPALATLVAMLNSIPHMHHHKDVATVSKDITDDPVSFMFDAEHADRELGVVTTDCLSVKAMEPEDMANGPFSGIGVFAGLNVINLPRYYRNIGSALRILRFQVDDADVEGLETLQMDKNGIKAVVQDTDGMVHEMFCDFNKGNVWVCKECDTIDVDEVLANLGVDLNKDLALGKGYAGPDAHTNLDDTL